jgi:hypothetical protein
MRKTKFTKEQLDKVATIMFNALIEVQVSPHAPRCGLRFYESVCNCHVAVATEAIRKAKEEVEWK